MKELISQLLQMKHPSEMEEFLRGLLTPQEIDTLATRIEIIKMLKKGVPQHEIATKLGVGVATVTRGSHELKKGRFTTL